MTTETSMSATEEAVDKGGDKMMKMMNEMNAMEAAVDKSGKKMPYKSYDGAKYQAVIPGDAKQHLTNIGQMTYFPDDVIVLSYLKSGTHWVYEIVNMIKTGKAEYHERAVPALDYFPMEKLESVPSPRIYASHLFTRHLPENFVKNRQKIVYVYRNPKDVSVSYYNFIKNMKMIPYDGKWEDFFEMWVHGDSISTWFEQVKDVADFKEKNPDYPILTVSYENMKKDLVTEVKKIAAFLEPTVDTDLCKQIAEKCQFTEMNKAKNKTLPAGMEKISKSGTHIMYRKGEVGDWKNWYTVAMNEAFDKIYEKEMAGLNLDVKFTI